MVLLGIGSGAILIACGGSPAAPSQSSSLSVGQWSGTTAQGAAIAFSVSSDEFLTTISVGYNFNGCVGSQVFANVHVPTAPNVICIPGPCPDTLYRSLHYSGGTRGDGPVTTVNGVSCLAGGRRAWSRSRTIPAAGPWRLWSGLRHGADDRRAESGGRGERVLRKRRVGTTTVVPLSVLAWRRPADQRVPLGIVERIHHQIDVEVGPIEMVRAG